MIFYWKYVGEDTRIDRSREHAIAFMQQPDDAPRLHGRFDGVYFSDTINTQAFAHLEDVIVVNQKSATKPVCKISLVEKAIVFQVLLCEISDEIYLVIASESGCQVCYSLDSSSSSLSPRHHDQPLLLPPHVSNEYVWLNRYGMSEVNICISPSPLLKSWVIPPVCSYIYTSSVLIHIHPSVSICRL